MLNLTIDGKPISGVVTNEQEEAQNEFINRKRNLSGSLITQKLIDVNFRDEILSLQKVSLEDLNFLREKNGEDVEVSLAGVGSHSFIGNYNLELGSIVAKSYLGRYTDVNIRLYFKEDFIEKITNHYIDNLNYTPTSDEISNLKDILYKQNDAFGKLPVLSLNAKSVNPNLVRFSNDLTGLSWNTNGGTTVSDSLTFTSGVGTSADLRLNLTDTASELPNGAYNVSFAAKSTTSGTFDWLVDIADTPPSSVVQVTNVYQTFNLILNKSTSNTWIDFNPQDDSTEFQLTNVSVTKGSYSYKERSNGDAIEPIDFGSSLSSWSFQNYGQGLKAEFDNQGNQFIPFNSALTQTVNSNYTTHSNQTVVETWIKPNLSAGLQCVWNKGSASSRVFIDTAGNLFYRSNIGEVSTPSGTLVDGQLHHILVAFDSDNPTTYKSDGVAGGSAKIWVDGTPQSQGDGLTITPNTDPWQVSRTSGPLNSGVYAFNVYHGVANDEIALSLYNKGL